LVSTPTFFDIAILKRTLAEANQYSPNKKSTSIIFLTMFFGDKKQGKPYSFEKDLAAVKNFIA
jgi:hypothetical protein